MSKESTLKYWAPLFLYTLVIFFISSIPGDLIKTPPRFNDKLFHLLLYLGLGVFALRAFSQRSKIRILGLIGALVYCCVVAILDEAYQGLIPQRMVDPFDLLSDFAGLTLGVIAYLNYFKSSGK
jgi:VanZ family protein